MAEMPGHPVRRGGQAYERTTTTHYPKDLGTEKRKLGHIEN